LKEVTAPDIAPDIDKFQKTSRVMLAEAKKQRPQRTVACTMQPSFPNSKPGTEQGASRPPGESEVRKEEAQEASPAGYSEAGKEPGFLQRQLVQIQQLEEAVLRDTHAVASSASYVDTVESSGNSHPPTPLSDEGDSSVLLDVVSKLRQFQKVIIVGEWHSIRSKRNKTFIRAAKRAMPIFCPPHVYACVGLFVSLVFVRVCVSESVFVSIS